MSDETRQARIEAMAKAMEEQVQTMGFSGTVPWETASESRKAYFRELATVAADAAAAPAVGVTVAWLDERIAETQKNISEIQQNRAGVIELFGASERIRAFREVRALLTAQPEPGTHGDAGQPATE